THCCALPRSPRPGRGDRASPARPRPPLVLAPLPHPPAQRAPGDLPELVRPATETSGHRLLRALAASAPAPFFLGPLRLAAPPLPGSPRPLPAAHQPADLPRHARRAGRARGRYRQSALRAPPPPRPEDGP